MGISVTYDSMRDSLRVTGICKKCDKRRTRTVSDYQTISPFNKRKDGIPKNSLEIREELRASVLAQANKLRENFICATCLSALPWPRKWPESEGDQK